MPAQRQNRGGRFLVQGHFPGLGRLDRIGGTEDEGVGRSAQHGEVLDRLVRRAVFAKADGIVGHHIDNRNPHQRREAHRTAGIVGKAHEGAAIGAGAAMQRHAVHRRGHTMLADSVIDIAALAVGGVEHAHVASLGIVRAGKVGRAAHGLAHDRVDDRQRHFRGFAGRVLGLGLRDLFLQLADRGGELVRDLASIGAGKLGLLGARELGKFGFP